METTVCDPMRFKQFSLRGEHQLEVPSRLHSPRQNLQLKDLRKLGKPPPFVLPIQRQRKALRRLLVGILPTSPKLSGKSISLAEGRARTWRLISGDEGPGLVRIKKIKFWNGANPLSEV